MDRAQWLSQVTEDVLEPDLAANALDRLLKPR